MSTASGAGHRLPTPRIPRTASRQLDSWRRPVYRLCHEMDIDGPTDAEQLASYQRVFPVFWEHHGSRHNPVGIQAGMWRARKART